MCTLSNTCLIDWIVFLRPTTPITTKAHTHQSKEIYNNTKEKKLKPGLLVTSYDIQPGNGGAYSGLDAW